MIPIPSKIIKSSTENKTFAHIYFCAEIEVQRSIEFFNIFRKDDIPVRKIANPFILSTIKNIIMIISCLPEILAPETPFILNKRINETVINPK